jgi:hypothetical protein
MNAKEIRLQLFDNTHFSMRLSTGIMTFSRTIQMFKVSKSDQIPPVITSFYSFYKRLAIAAVCRYVQLEEIDLIPMHLDIINDNDYYELTPDTNDDLVRLLYILFNNPSTLDSSVEVKTEVYESFTTWDRQYRLDKDITLFWHTIEVTSPEDIHIGLQKELKQLVLLFENYQEVTAQNNIQDFPYLQQFEVYCRIRLMISEFEEIVKSTDNSLAEACMYNYIRPVISKFQAYQEHLQEYEHFSDQLFRKSADLLFPLSEDPLTVPPIFLPALNFALKKNRHDSTRLKKLIQDNTLNELDYELRAFVRNEVYDEV